MMFIYKIYSIVVALPLFLIDTLFTALVSSAAAMFPCGDRVYTKVTRWWGKNTCRLFLLPVEVRGTENLNPDQSYVFLANHQSYLDIFICYGYLKHNFKWMMKEYLRKMPIIGWACENTHQIYVGDSISSIQRAVEQSKETLRGGMSMVIFPEGTRTHDGKLGEFKRGAFMLANEIGLPIVPLTLTGGFEAFNRKAWSVTRHKLTLTMHHPISVEDRKGIPTKKLMQNVHDIIEESL